MCRKCLIRRLQRVLRDYFTPENRDAIRRFYGI